MEKKAVQEQSYDRTAKKTPKNQMKTNSLIYFVVYSDWKVLGFLAVKSQSLLSI